MENIYQLRQALREYENWLCRYSDVLEQGDELPLMDVRDLIRYAEKIDAAQGTGYRDSIRKVDTDADFEQAPHAHLALGASLESLLKQLELRQTFAPTGL